MERRTGIIKHHPQQILSGCRSFFQLFSKKDCNRHKYHYVIWIRKVLYTVCPLFGATLRLSRRDDIRGMCECRATGDNVAFPLLSPAGSPIPTARRNYPSPYLNSILYPKAPPEQGGASHFYKMQSSLALILFIFWLSITMNSKRLNSIRDYGSKQRLL